MAKRFRVGIYFLGLCLVAVIIAFISSSFSLVTTLLALLVIICLTLLLLLSAFFKAPKSREVLTTYDFLDIPPGAPDGARIKEAYANGQQYQNKNN